MRDFDGTDDNIAFGSDASIDGYTTLTYSLWSAHDALAADTLIGKEAGDAQTGSGFYWDGIVTGDLTFAYDFTNTLGVWRTGDVHNDDGVWHHVAVTYDRSSTANVPIIYIDGTKPTITTTQAPVGTSESDTAQTLRAGEEANGSQDLDGRMAFLCYDDAIWTDADVNRARWWGRPFGGIQVYHPLMTNKLTNEGAATANGTATGTTNVGAAIPVVRPGMAMMGMGIGW